MTQLRHKFIFLAFMFLLGAVQAQGAVSVQPNAIIHTAAPGDLISQQLRIDNPGTAELDVSIYPGDWQHDSAGQVVYFPSGTLEHSAADWLSFDQASLTLAGRGEATVTYTVSVPADAQPGSYWAALFAEGVNPDSEQSQALTTFRMRTAHMVYVNIPPATSGGRITAILGEHPAAEDGPYTMHLTYLNEGNTIQILTGRVQIRTVAGELVETITMDRVLALPGIARTFSMDLFGPIPAGDYLALAVLNYGDSGTDVAGEFVFSLNHDLAPASFVFDEAAERARLVGEQNAREQAE